MNISASTIYLWQLADDLRSTTGALSFITGTLAVFATFFLAFTMIEDDGAEYKGIARRMFAGCVALFLSMLCASTLIPKSSTVAMMVVVPEIAKSKVVQQDLPDLYNAAVEALKSAIEKP